MYIPRHFEVTDWGEITAFVAHARAADLVTVDADGLPIATLMPCQWNLPDTLAEGYGSLVMHMAKANAQWKSITSDSQGLAIVHGHQAYVSPSNYEGKDTDHKVVPTWNYQSVHLSGRVEVSEDNALLRTIVTELTQFHEANRDEPWSVDQADPRYIEAQLNGIVAVILRVDRVEAKYKLSQNRSQQDRLNVIADLERSERYEEQAIASEMKRKALDS